VLRKCFADAIAHSLAAQNPVSRLPKSEKPELESRESAYFENEEIPLLFSHVPRGLYRMLMLSALKTGMRLGELSALTWGDVDLAQGVVRVRRSYTDGRLDVPKNRKRRDVDLPADVVELLGEWWGECGRPADEVLVFPGSRSGMFLNPSVARAQLYASMEAAGIPRVGPTGERRGFHSFRHTFAKRALESGRQITWLSRHLGHSSLAITSETYGHWERAERKREAEQMAGVFGV
jgi:integrase